MSKILTFNGNVLSKNGFGLTFGGYVPPPLPSNTIQFQFSDTSHDYTFTDCGDYSQSGTAELNQIPSDWGGRA